MAEKVLPITVKLDGDVKTFEIMASDVKNFAKAMASAVATSRSYDKFFGSKLNRSFINTAAISTTVDSFNSSLQSMMGSVQNLTDAYASQQEMEAKLGQVMRNTMDASDLQIDSIKRLCSQQQKLGVIGDEVQLAGAQELSTYLTKTSTLKKLIPVMNDMLAQQYGLNATQEAAANIATMLGKVMDGQTGALKRYGYAFDDAQKAILQTGTEEERAATLAEVVTGSVGGMNQALAQTPTGKIKQLTNSLGDMKERLGKVAAKVQPILQFGASATTAFTGLKKLNEGGKTLCAWMLKGLTSMKAMKVATKEAGAASATAGTAVKGYSVATRAATIATHTFKAALRGLMSATVIGAVLAALGLVLEKIMEVTNATDELEDATKEAAEAAAEAAAEHEEWKRSLTDTSEAAAEAAAGELANVDKLYKAATDDSKSRKKRVAAAKELIKTYPEWFRNAKAELIILGKASAAYEKLRTDILNAARARAIGEKIAENEKEKIKLEEDRDKLIKSGVKTRDQLNASAVALNASADEYLRQLRGADNEKTKNWMVYVAESGSPTGHPSPSTTKNFYDQANESLDLAFRGKDLDSRMKKHNEDVVKHGELSKTNEKIAEIDKSNAFLNDELNKLPTSDFEFGREPADETKNKKTKYEQAGEAIQKAKDKYAENSMEIVRLPLGDARQKALLKENKQLLENIDALENYRKAYEQALATVDAPDMENLSTPEDFDKAIAYIDKQLEVASFDSAAKLNKQKTDIQAQRRQKEYEAHVAVPPEQIKSYTELSNEIQFLQGKLQDVTTEAQRKEVQDLIDTLEELRRKWDEAIAAPESIDKLNTQDALEEAISYYEGRMKYMSADDAAETQLTINALQRKADAITRAADLATKLHEVGEINALPSEEYTLHVRAMGFEAITEEIKSLQKLMRDTENPLTKTERENVEKLIGTYSKWRETCAKSFDTYRRGWEGISNITSDIDGLGDSISSLADAFSGSQKSAWERITGAIDGLTSSLDRMLSLYDAIKEVKTVVEMLTKATEVHEAATIKDTMATTANNVAEKVKTLSTETSTAATIKDTIATTGNAIASKIATQEKSGEAVADATKEGAKLPWPMNLVAIAGGVAAVVGALSLIGTFATGGIVGGTSNSGDKVLARVNSGEMILNRAQQARLFKMINTAQVQPVVYRPVAYDAHRGVETLRSNLNDAPKVAVSGRVTVENRKLVVALSNETRVASRSGRKSNIIV